MTCVPGIIACQGKVVEISRDRELLELISGTT